MPTIVEATLDHPTASRSRRFRGDIRLRDHGYQIVARKKDAPAIWLSPSGHLVTEREAHEEVNRQIAAEVCEGA